MNCLCNSHLKSTNLLFHIRPVNLAPRFTAGWRCTSHSTPSFASLHYARFCKLSYNERPVGCGRTFVPSHQDLYPRYYRVAFAFSNLSNPHCHRPASRLAVLLPGAVRGFHVPLTRVCWVRCRFSTGKPIGYEIAFWKRRSSFQYLLVQALKPLSLVSVHGL